MDFEDLIELRWKYGGPRDVWLQNVDLVKQIIDKGKLSPLGQEIANAPMLALRLSGDLTAAAVPEAVASRRGFPGGIKIPHLHLGDKVYLVNEEQWKAFSGRIVDDLKARLDSAKGISFQQTMLLGEARQAIGH